jgi:hypothetical protein
MNRIFTLLIIAVMAGCAASPLALAKDASDTTATAVNDAEKAAQIAYSQAQESVISKDMVAGASEAQATADVLAVRAKWAPVWKAFADLHVASSVLVSAISVAEGVEKAGGQPDMTNLAALQDKLTLAWAALQTAMGQVGL